MNIPLVHAETEPTRRLFTVDDVRRMVDAGVLGEEENFELVEGELIMMAAKSLAHENIKSALILALARAVPDGYYIGVESTAQLSNITMLEPDLTVISRQVYKGDPASYPQPRAEDVLLVIEVAVSSLAYDRRTKARLYAQHGFPEFWVIDAKKRVTWIHTGPKGDTWSSIVKRGADEELRTPLLPNFAIRLADI
jgi:Uma2 family endonuclease